MAHNTPAKPDNATKTAQLALKAFGMKNKGKVTFFLDIDETLALDGKLLPETEKALNTAHDSGADIVFVTGRNRDGLKNQNGLKVQDGAVHDVLGGYESWMSKCPMVAGHGMEFFDGEKDHTLGRSPEEEKFASFAGKQVNAFICKLNTDIPETVMNMDLGVKTHTIYANYSKLKAKDKELAKTVAKRIETAFANICKGKSFDGKDIKGAPENPGKAFTPCKEVDSFELRSNNWSKQKGLEASGLLEKALEGGGKVIVGCNSLKPSGTDRGMVIAARESAKKSGDKSNVIVVHVLNGRPQNKLDKTDKCAPDYEVLTVADFGKAMDMFAKGRTTAKEQNNIKAAANALSGALLINRER